MWPLTSELRTLEAAEPLCRVTAEVGEQVGPVAAVGLGVVGQAQGHRHVGVLRLTRHLDRQEGAERGEGGEGGGLTWVGSPCSHLTYSL